MPFVLNYLHTCIIIRKINSSKSHDRLVIEVDFVFVCQGANTSDKEDDRKTSDPFKRLDMDLDK